MYVRIYKFHSNFNINIRIKPQIHSLMKTSYALILNAFGITGYGFAMWVDNSTTRMRTSWRGLPLNFNMFSTERMCFLKGISHATRRTHRWLRPAPEQAAFCGEAGRHRVPGRRFHSHWWSIHQSLDRFKGTFSTLQKCCFSKPWLKMFPYNVHPTHLGKLFR